MMKEFRFEPSSQMIEVQEGQNLKIQITGYRTAYRSVESMENPVGCIRICCAKCVSPSTPLFLQVWRRLSKSQFILIILWISIFFAFFHGCGYIAKPRWQTCRRNHGYESIVSVALEVVCASSREERTVLGMVDQFRYLTSGSWLSLPAGLRKNSC